MNLGDVLSNMFQSREDDPWAKLKSDAERQRDREAKARAMAEIYGALNQRMAPTGRGGYDLGTGAQMMSALPGIMKLFGGGQQARGGNFGGAPGGLGAEYYNAGGGMYM